MSSAAGGTVFAIAAVFLISCDVLLILRHYLPLRSTPGYVLVPVFLALALPIGLILLLPIDLASSLKDDGESQGIWLPERAVLVAWRIAYWLTFCLTWFILPLLGEYVDSGYRTPRDRIIYSLRSNARYQLIALSCGLLGLAYIFWQNGFYASNVKSLVMALAYCVGLIQAVLLLGHGLVAVPRYFFRNQGTRLRRLQTRAPKTKDKLEDAVAEMQQLDKHVTELKSRKRGLSKDMEDWIDEIGDERRYTPVLPASTIPSHNRSQPVPAVVTDRYLADTARRLNRTRHKVIRFTYEWNQLVDEARDLLHAIDSHATKRLEPFKNDTTILAKVRILTPHMRYLLYCRIIPALRIAFGVFLGVASVSIIWSELVKFKAPQISVISLTVIRHAGDAPKVGFSGQLISVLWIMYMCTCTLASLQDVKVWGNRALVRRNTYYESACWYALQVAKMTVPLTFNFLTFTPEEVRKETVFYKFLGQQIDLTPLGKNFDYFFPFLVLVPAAATLFHVYGRFKKVLGYGVFEEEDEEDGSFGTGSWQEGRRLIEEAIQDRAHTNSTGLPDRAHVAPFTDQPEAPRREPTIYVPPGEDRRTAQRQAERLAAATQAAEDADDNFFSEFAHRVRNTIDNVERPDWLPEFGKRPKWMGGNDNVESSNQGSGTTRQDSNGIGRLFGIKKPSSGGRIRL